MTACVLLVNDAYALEAPAVGASCMAVTAHPLATEAAVSVLRDGGNAVDAVIAAAFTLAVVEPYASGLGGGGFVVGWLAPRAAAFALDCRETAPAAATRNMFLASDGTVDLSRSQSGGLAVAVPGLVRGLWDLHVRHGRLPWPRLLADATRLARDGFPVTAPLVSRILEDEARLDSGLRALLLPGGRPPAEDTLLRQPDLARTLARIAAEGPEAFYAGEVADRLVATVRDAGGLLTRDDLAGYVSVWREPVVGTYRGLQVVSMPPPSSGGVLLLEMLNVLEGFDLAAGGYGSAVVWHPMLEAMKFAYADRSRFLGDADFVPVPVTRLTSRAYADSLRARIRPDRAIPPEQITGAAAVLPEPGHTTHVSVVDVEGNAAAATLTINLTFGAGLLAEGTGVILNDEMDDFVAAPGVPNAFGLLGGDANAVAPGKRPLSSMTPTIVLDADRRVLLVTGSPSGSRIITTVLQTVVNVVDFGMDALTAVRVPRVHHQWSPPTAFYEAYGLAPETRARLEALGHTFAERPAIGLAQLIVRDREAGVWTGASDPRGAGLAKGF
jgi:gamma-glutamyltranspeptidase/glutathione hydrolase